jgi:hypothetical protein
MKSLFIALLFISSIVFAQNGRRDVLNPDQLGVKELKLEAQKTAPSGIIFPFKSIKIIDSRYDTSKMGYVPTTDILAGKRKAYKKMVLQGGNGNAIETYYNDYYAGSFTQNDFELLIVMKRFWLAGDANSNSKGVEVTNSVNDNDNLYCKWEYYLGKDGNYLPFKRIDTVIRINEKLAKYIDEEFSEKRLSYFKFSLKALIEILDYSHALKQFDNQPKKTLAQIQEFNKKVNIIPVLQDSVFKKGVYLSFDDFKNNRPSITDFKEKKMHYGKINANTEIYLEDMKGETIGNYWGYSDGKEFRYGMLGNDKIFRIQNTFCFFINVVGYEINLDNSQYNRGSDFGTISKDKYKVWVPFQIDMETGEIY